MAKVMLQVSVASTNSQILFKKHIKHSEPDTTLLEFIASFCLDDGSHHLKSILTVFTDTNFFKNISIPVERQCLTRVTVKSIHSRILKNTVINLTFLMIQSMIKHL